MTEVLRAGVLAGVRLGFAGGPSPCGAAVRERATALGATDAGSPDTLVATHAASPATLVVDAAGAAGPLDALDGAWDAVRPVAEAMIAAGGGGQVVLLAPPPGDPPAEAARAGLENLARTLSIEWARYAIRPVAILPGRATSPAEVAELVCFLASPAGAYYAGCAFTLGSASG